MSRLAFFLAVWLAVASLPAGSAEPWLVLVVSAESPIASLSPSDARRLYLGIPISRNGHEITPLLNVSDDTAKEMFLQRVLFMSAQTYERQMTARLYRSGGERVREYQSLRDLVAMLVADPYSVSYMTEETALGIRGIKIIAAL
jgi:hypothetical protein